MFGIVSLFSTPPQALGLTQKASSYMFKYLTTGTRTKIRSVIVAQNGIIAVRGGPQLHAQPSQLFLYLSGALCAAFADDDARSFRDKETAERQPNLAAALNGNQFALNCFSEPFSGRLRNV